MELTMFHLNASMCTTTTHLKLFIYLGPGSQIVYCTLALNIFKKTLMPGNVVSFYIPLLKTEILFYHRFDTLQSSL